MKVLVFDVGTQRLKVSTVLPSGEIDQIVSWEYDPPCISPRPGWAEVNVEEIFQRALEMAESLNLDGVGAVTVTTQRDSLVFVDESGRPLRNTILWLDHRLADYDLKLPPLIDLVYTLAGAKRVIRAVYRQAKVNWVRQNEPEVWRKTHKVLQVSGYFIQRMTGRFVDSVASQVGHIPFDYKRRKWCSPRDIKSFLFPIPREKLPDLGEPGELAGTLKKDVARELGLGEIPVILSGSDKACEILGLGVTDESTLALSLSTTSIAATTTRRYFEPLPHLPPYPGMIPGTYNPEIEIFRGFWLVRWFRDEFAHLEKSLAREREVSAEELLDELLKRSSPGTFGLVTHPYWTPGLDRPRIRGSMIGFSSFHGRKEVYRSIIEGLFFALREGKERLEKRGKLSFEKVVVGGGGSKSEEVVKIAASVIGLPVYRGVGEVSIRGAAIAAFVGMGIFKDFESAVREMTKLEGPFQPDPSAHRLYDLVYRRIYLRIDSSLKRIHREIDRIFGEM